MSFKNAEYILPKVMTFNSFSSLNVNWILLGWTTIIILCCLVYHLNYLVFTYTILLTQNAAFSGFAVKVMPVIQTVLQ